MTWRTRLWALVCRVFGHDPIWVDAEPVTAFWLCRRCGKYTRER